MNIVSFDFFKDTEEKEEEPLPSGALHKNNVDDRIFGNVIAKLCTTYYVMAHASVNDVADALETYRDIKVLGVVCEDMSFLGIITRKELFNKLGTRFGRSICYYKKIHEFVETPEDVFLFNRNIYSVVSLVKERLDVVDEYFYLLKDKENKFFGIFSNLDVMIYLSSITNRDMQFASTLMNQLVKKEFILEEECFTLVGCSRMAKGVGGDMYKVKGINSYRRLLSIWDVSGKGVSSSIATSYLSGIFQFFDFSRNLDGFIVNLNKSFCRSFKLEKFVTGILIDYNIREKCLYFYNFGHSLFYLFRGERKYRIDPEKSNLPIGIDQDITPFRHRISLNRNDLVFLFTDGIMDQTNKFGEKYDLQRIHDIVMIYQSGELSSLREVRERIIEDIDRFRGSQPQDDDLTFLLLEHK